MIRHIVLFSVKDAKDIDTVYSGLKMLESIKGNWTLSVTRNSKIDQIENEIDVVVYGEFPDEAALALYKSDPVYQEAIRVVRPLRDVRIAVDVPA